MTRDILMRSAAFAGGLLVGATSAYFVAKRLADRRAETEIQDIRETYREMTREYQTRIEKNKDVVEGPVVEQKLEMDFRLPGAPAPIQDDIRPYKEKLEEAGYQVPRLENLSVFQKEDTDKMVRATGSEPVDEIGEELFDRSKPYIISAQEFISNDTTDEGIQPDKITLTYFVEDDTLVDDQEVEIPDSDAVVGNINLGRFGYRSDDVNIVYVRNESIGADFEIIRDHRSFVEVVLGLNLPDKVEKPRIGKFRDSD